MYQEDCPEEVTERSEDAFQVTEPAQRAQTSISPKYESSSSPAFQGPLARRSSRSELIQDAEEGRLETLWNKGSCGGTRASELVLEGLKPQRGPDPLRLPRAAGRRWMGSCPEGKASAYSLSLFPARPHAAARGVTRDRETCPSQISASRLTPRKPPCSRGAAVAPPAPGAAGTGSFSLQPRDFSRAPAPSAPARTELKLLSPRPAAQPGLGAPLPRTQGQGSAPRAAAGGYRCGCHLRL